MDDIDGCSADSDTNSPSRRRRYSDRYLDQQQGGYHSDTGYNKYQHGPHDPHVPHLPHLLHGGTTSSVADTSTDYDIGDTSLTGTGTRMYVGESNRGGSNVVVPPPSVGASTSITYSDARGGTESVVVVPAPQVPRGGTESSGAVSGPGPRGTSGTSSSGYRLGLQGWRRRCLYLLLMFLTATVTLNLALTLFFMRVLDFSRDGLGALQIVRGGLVATGPVHVLDSLVASHVTSRPHAPLTLVSAYNVSLAALGEEGTVTSAMILDKNSLSVSTGKLIIKDNKGNVVLAASKEQVELGAKRLVVSGDAGASFTGSVQTTHVSSPVGSPLLLQSKTRGLELSAPQGVSIESSAGNIEAKAIQDFTLQSTGGMIKLLTSRLLMKGLPTSTVQNTNPASVRPDVYQVCVCSGGRIFLAAPWGLCAADSNICK